MSSSSLSMFAATTAISCSSSHSHTKISKLFHFFSPFTTTHYSQNPILKPLFHKTQIHHPIFSLSSHFQASAADFDYPENAQEQEEDDDVVEEEEDDFSSEEDIDDDDERHNGSDSREIGRLYVGNLPYSMTSSQLAEVFGEAGRVDSVEIVYNRVTDRSRGFAFVSMNNIDDAKKAILMFDGALVGGRTVKVNFPEVPKGGEREVMGPKIRDSYKGFVDTPHKIYAGNLGWNLNSQGLKDAFADQPGFLSAKVIYSRDSGKSQGFGFVSFASADAVVSALKAMNGVEVEGRPLRLNLASERPPSSPPPIVKRNST